MKTLLLAKHDNKRLFDATQKALTAAREYCSPVPLSRPAGVRAGDVSTWVMHGPGYVDTVPRQTAPKPAVILAGHTHGGQIRLPFYTPYTPVGSGRFVAGWYRDTVAPLYVSRGIGTVLVPARLFCPPELPVFTLRRGPPHDGPRAPA